VLIGIDCIWSSQWHIDWLMFNTDFSSILAISWSCNDWKIHNKNQENVIWNEFHSNIKL
jgi:hypothetical protein